MSTIALRITIFMASLFLAACSSPTSRLTPGDSVNSVSREVINTATDVSQEAGSLLFIGRGHVDQTLMFNGNNKKVGTLQLSDGYSAFNRQGDFYNVPANITSELEILKPPYKSEPETIKFSNGSTADVAVDPRTNIFAVTLEYGNEGTGPSEVEFFKPGTKVPCAVVMESPGIDYIASASAFDREGRLFGVVELSNSEDTAIGEIDGECNSTAIKIDTLPSQSIFPARPPAFNLDDNLVFQNYYTGEVLTFAHPKNGQFGQALRSTTLSIGGKKPASAPILRCLSSDGKHLWANAGQDILHTDTLREWKYPAGGDPVVTIHVKDAFNCASYPQLIPRSTAAQFP